MGLVYDDRRYSNGTVMVYRFGQTFIILLYLYLCIHWMLLVGILNRYWCVSMVDIWSDGRLWQSDCEEMSVIKGDRQLICEVVTANGPTLGRYAESLQNLNLHPQQYLSPFSLIVAWTSLAEKFVNICILLSFLHIFNMIGWIRRIPMLGAHGDQWRRAEVPGETKGGSLGRPREDQGILGDASATQCSLTVFRFYIAFHLIAIPEHF